MIIIKKIVYKWIVLVYKANKMILYNHIKISELIFAPNLLEGYTESFFEVDYKGNLSYLNISYKFLILSSLSIE